MKRIVFIILVIGFITSSYDSSYCALGYVVRLRAYPPAIIADSNSATTITAEVIDQNGRPAPDGTTVEFTTNMGVIDRSINTVSGVARARLQSSSSVGTANVSVVVRKVNAIAQIKVDFLAPGTQLLDESYITISSPKYLGFDVSSRIIDAAGGVNINYRGMTFKAFEAQISVDRNILKAKAQLGGDYISIERGDKTILASALYYDFSAMRGIIITPPDEGAKQYVIRGWDMFTELADSNTPSTNFEFTPIANSDMFIKASAMIIYPGKEIKIKRANVYVQGDKVISIPLHRVSLRGDPASTGQFLAYGTDGLRMDLPIYYSLTESTSGAVRFKRSEPGGWGYYTGRRGWQVDIEQEYNTGGSTDGVFTLNRFGTNEWGARWNHRSEFKDNARIYTLLEFPEHKDLYGTFDYNKSYDNYNVAFNLRGSNTKSAGQRYLTYGYIQTRPKYFLPKAVTYSLSTKLAYDTKARQGATKTDTSAGFQLNGVPWIITPVVNLSSSLSYNHSWRGARSGDSIIGTSGIYTNIGDLGQFGLSYNYFWEKNPSIICDQTLSSDVYFGDNLKWIAHFNATRMLSTNATSAFAELGWEFVSNWNVRAIATYQEYDIESYTDMEFILGRVLGTQEAQLIWSKSNRKIRFEFTTAGF